MKSLKVALAHDYLREYGGAEKVLEVLHEMFPEAPVYTAYVNLKRMGENGKRFASWDIRPSWFQKFPFANRLLSPFRIFAPLMFESFDLSEYDLVISSSSATHLAKSVITKPEMLHLSYIHTPPRFLYGYTTSFNYKKHWWTRIGGEIINHFMRIWDFEVSQRPDILVANSKNVAERIKKFYRRDSVVIYPPVDLGEFTGHRPSALRTSTVSPSAVSSGPNCSVEPLRLAEVQVTERKYFLALNRLVRGKGTEVIVQAATKLNLPLKVAGTGPEMDYLKSIAGKNVEFLGWVSDEERIELLAKAKALIVASEDEDFGIISVEAQAAGTPVIAPRSGGYLETVIEDKTGQFFNNATIVELMKVLKGFDPKQYKAENCRKNAERFSKERFKKQFMELVEKKY